MKCVYCGKDTGSDATVCNECLLEHPSDVVINNSDKPAEVNKTEENTVKSTPRKDERNYETATIIAFVVYMMSSYTGNYIYSLLPNLPDSFYTTLSELRYLLLPVCLIVIVFCKVKCHRNKTISIIFNITCVLFVIGIIYMAFLMFMCIKCVENIG